MQYSEVLTVKLSKSEVELLDRKAQAEKVSRSEVIRKGMRMYMDPNIFSMRLLPEEREMLEIIAKEHGTDLESALRKVLLGYFLLVNKPLKDVLKPLGEIIKGEE